MTPQVGQARVPSVIFRLGGVVVIGCGIYYLVHRDSRHAAARQAARYHRWQASRFPWLYWFPRSREFAESETVWRGLMPVFSILLILVGLFLVIFPSGFPN